MPFFKFRRGDASPTPPAGSATQAQSVEVLRKRAKHRLIGASVLVLLGVIGFPMLFETQPRTVGIDIPIEIPGKNTVKPLVVPVPGPVVAATPAPGKPAASAAQTVTAASSLSSTEEIYSSKPAEPVAEPVPKAIKKEAKPETRPEAKVEVKPEAKPRPEPKSEAKTEPRPVEKVEARPVAKPEPQPAPAPAKSAPQGDDGIRALALLNARPAAQPSKAAAVTKPATPEETKAASAETKGRMVVQVGAFADAAKAEETRRKLEKAGLTTYTQVVDTKEGKRVRVRVGPFASKAEAERAVNKIRALDLPVAVLSF